MDKNNLEEEVTQVANVDGGRVDIFGFKQNDEDILEDINAKLVEALNELEDYTAIDDENLKTQYNNIIDILKINPEEVLWSYYRVNDLSLNELKEIIEKAPDFVDMEMRQNGGPTIQAFLEFLEKNPEFRLEAYIITPVRGDYRLSIDGIYAEDTEDNINKLKDFISNWDYPDEFFTINDKIRAWWD